MFVLFTVAIQLRKSKSRHQLVLEFRLLSLKWKGYIITIITMARNLKEAFEGMYISTFPIEKRKSTSNRI